MAEEAKQWYQDNAPPQFCTGYLWWTWSCLIKNYNAGPWTVNVSSINGHCYIVSEDAPEGIFATGYVDTTELGTLAHLDWEPGCREEGLPLLLVHGWYPEAFDPAQEWRVMAWELTGKDPTQEADFALIYDPNLPGDEAHALKFLTGQGLDVYISNYTHAPENGTPGDIRQYAQSLAHEIEILKSHKGAPAVDILSHSMGGIVARAYIENEDLADNPFAVAYRDDVFNLIMLAPPNQGTRWSNLYPGWWDWTSIVQLGPDSDFLAQLNSGVTGQGKGVTYHIIAGNFYTCLRVPGFPSTYHASRLCELMDDEPNDGELTVSQTKLSKQGSLLEVLPENFHVRDWDHWEMLGRWDTPCDSETIVKIILAGYSLAKWRIKGKDIEPPEANYLQRCFNLIKRTDACHDLYDHIINANITIEFRDLPTGTVAQWFPDDNTIGVDISAEALDEKVTCQHIIHEAEHARWHNEDSISQQYHAFKAEADVLERSQEGRPGRPLRLGGRLHRPGPGSSDELHPLLARLHWPARILWGELRPSPRLSAPSKTAPPATGFASTRSGWECSSRTTATSGACMDTSGSFHNTHLLTTIGKRGRGRLYDTWQAESLEVNVAGLAYLVKSATQNQVLPTIDREYAAFMYMARIWRAIKGSQEHDLCDEVDFYMDYGKGTACEWIRSRYEYADFPQEYFTYPTPADGRLHVYFLDVGEGDGMFIVTPQGSKIVIDGGPGTLALINHVGRHLAPWDRRIDAMILTHADADHITGQIPILDRYYVNKVFDSGFRHSNPTYVRWMTMVLDKRIAYNEARAGMIIDTGDGVTLTLFHPPTPLMSGTGADANNNSIVARLVYGDVSFLLTGDIEAEAEQRMLDAGYPLESTVLKVPHHGADTSSTQAFLDAVNPQMAVISAGLGNSFGHPDGEVLSRLLALVGSEHLYRTDYHGTVEITVEGALCPVTFHPITVVPPMPEEGEPPEEPTGKIDINNASQAELETLPAIGPTKAQRIIQYRPYESIEEITIVPGIGPLTFEKIKDLICAEPCQEPPEEPEEPEEEEEEEEEEERTQIEKALSVLRNSPLTRHLYDYIVDNDIKVEWGELPIISPTIESPIWAEEAYPPGALWYPNENTIKVDPSFENVSHVILAVYLAREAERSRWKGEPSLEFVWQVSVIAKKAYEGARLTYYDDWAWANYGFTLQGVLNGRPTMFFTYEQIPGLDDLPRLSGVHESLYPIFENLIADVQGPLTFEIEYEYAVFLERNGIQVMPSGERPSTPSWYEPSTKTIYLNENLLDQSTEVGTAYLAYQSVHAEWDRCYSIDQEYHAHKRQAEIWEQIGGGLTHADHDFFLELYQHDINYVKDQLRTLYPDLPEVCPGGRIEPGGRGRDFGRRLHSDVPRPDEEHHRGPRVLRPAHSLRGWDWHQGADRRSVGRILSRRRHDLP